MAFPVVHKGITLTEIPGRIAVFFEFGNCHNYCSGCHSTELWYTEGTECFPNMYMLDIIDYVKAQYEKGANAVVFMGGLNNCYVSTVEFHRLCKKLYGMNVDIGLYDGCQNAELNDIIPIFLDYHEGETPECMLKWIKIGPYISEKGGLDHPGTNQKFFEQSNSTPSYWSDMTEKYFQKGNKNEDDT